MYPLGTDDDCEVVVVVRLVALDVFVELFDSEVVSAAVDSVVGWSWTEAVS